MQLNCISVGFLVRTTGTPFKTLHILSYIDETYRRDIKGIRNLQEGRHALARKICHGKKGELYHRYERGLENQLGSLGLVLNCVTLWTTVYLDAAVRQLKAQGCPVLAPAPSASCVTPAALTRTTSKHVSAAAGPADVDAVPERAVAAGRLCCRSDGRRRGSTGAVRRSR